MSNLNDLITDIMVKNCQIDLRDWAGITMSDAQVRDLISDEDPFVATLLAYYRNDSDAHGAPPQGWSISGRLRVTVSETPPADLARAGQPAV